MVNSSDNLQEALRAATVEICATWDIDIPDANSIEIAQVRESDYEALVPISGRILLDNLLDTQGPLLGIKNDIAVELDGFQNDRLLLSLDLD